MFRFIRLFLGMLVRFFRVRQSLLLENLALRQQLAVLKQRHRSPCLSPFGCFYLVSPERIRGTLADCWKWRIEAVYGTKGSD